MEYYSSTETSEVLINVHFKWVNCALYTLYLNKAITEKKKRTLDHSSSDKQSLSDTEKEL